MKTFKDLEFKPHPNGQGGIQATIDFDNGYGASVVLAPWSYGGTLGLYELAVLHDGEITYDTPITGDVMGYLTEDEVTELFKQIQKL